MIDKVKSYTEDVNKEMRKVSWPARQELVSNTVLTLVAAGVLSLFIFGMDRVISYALTFIYGA